MTRQRPSHPLRLGSRRALVAAFGAAIVGVGMAAPTPPTAPPSTPPTEKAPVVAPPAVPPAAPPVGQPTGQPAAPENKGDSPTPPNRSLDELLGLEEATDDATAEAERRRNEALQRRLTEGEKRDAFLTAVDDMRRSAELLGDSFDTGLATQRLQESILDTLETLLRQPPQRSSDPSSQSDSQGDPANDPRQAPAQPMPQQASGAGQEEGAPDSAPGSPTAAEATLLEQALEGSGAEWGNLPDRVRDMIRQGLRDRPSSLYERLTESYYRRLAEESSR